MSLEAIFTTFFSAWVLSTVGLLVETGSGHPRMEGMGGTVSLVGVKREALKGKREGWGVKSGGLL